MGVNPVVEIRSPFGKNKNRILLLDKLMQKNLADKIKELPHKPGVYIFKDAKGLVLYVGKAINLRNALV